MSATETKMLCIEVAVPGVEVCECKGVEVCEREGVEVCKHEGV